MNNNERRTIHYYMIININKNSDINSDQGYAMVTRCVFYRDLNESFDRV